VFNFAGTEKCEKWMWTFVSLDLILNLSWTNLLFYSLKNQNNYQKVVIFGKTFVLLLCLHILLKILFTRYNELFTDYLRTTHELFTNYSRTIHELLTNYSQTTHELLTNYSRTMRSKASRYLQWTLLLSYF